MTFRTDATARPTRDEKLVGEFEVHLDAVRSLAPTTIEQYTRHTKLFLQYLHERGIEVEEVTSATVLEYLTYKAGNGSGPAIRKQIRFALIAFFNYHPSFAGKNNPSSETPAPRQRPPTTSAYNDEEAARILALAAERDDPRGRFEYTVLASARYTGLRVTELCSLTTGSIDLRQRRLRVLGKGAKWRNVPIALPLATVLSAYATDVRVLAPDSEFLLANPSPRKDRIHPRTVRYITKKYGEASGIAGPHNPHRWRHTCATSLLRGGVDLHIIQRFLGHSDIATTTRYLHMVDDDLRDAIDRTFI